MTWTAFAILAMFQIIFGRWWKKEIEESWLLKKARDRRCAGNQVGKSKPGGERGQEREKRAKKRGRKREKV